MAGAICNSSEGSVSSLHVLSKHGEKEEPHSQRCRQGAAEKEKAFVGRHCKVFQNKLLIYICSLLHVTMRRVSEEAGAAVVSEAVSC